MGSGFIQNDLTDNKKYQGVNNHIGGLNSFCLFLGKCLSIYARVPPNPHKGVLQPQPSPHCPLFSKFSILSYFAGL